MHEDTLISLLRDQGITLAASLPCDKAKELFRLLPESFETIELLREEDGVGVCAGAYLAGRKPAMFIQSSGLGNMLNALLSLSRTYELPLPVIASWRGVYKETIPAQVPFNTALPGILKAADIPFITVHHPREFDRISETIDTAFRCHTPAVALVSPQCWEGDAAGELQEDTPDRSRHMHIVHNRTVPSPTMTRLDAIRALVPHLHDAAVVSNIGFPSKELFWTGDRKENFYMLGSYTQASSLGFGIALSSRRRTIVIDGDGSLLGTAILPVIAGKKPRNLTIVCLDNGVFGSTGNQITPSYRQVDLELYARACGFEQTAKVTSAEETGRALASPEQGPSFIHVVIRPGNSDVPNIPLTPREIRDRFMNTIRPDAIQG
ncbi:MAG: sulfopyruvate decarboxylase subunit beta [Methanoregula sp.]|jgi:sulfopyruvate decarboxylase subunit beta|uniref:sulfopyruvate decarboxylase subunit beta n=1 Tax=Methanoregula sp. TaxID=2052170 RepID=UPI003C2147F8